MPRTIQLETENAAQGLFLGGVFFERPIFAGHGTVPSPESC